MCMVKACRTLIKSNLDKSQVWKKFSKEIKKPNEEYTFKQRIYTKGTNLSEDCKIKGEEIPKYCYYVPETKVKGDGFCINRQHPKQNDKDWYTTRSKKISTEDKYKQLMERLKTLNS